MLLVFLGKNGSYISLSETSTVNIVLFYFLYLQINYPFRTIKTTSFCNIKPVMFWCQVNDSNQGSSQECPAHVLKKLTVISSLISRNQLWLVVFRIIWRVENTDPPLHGPPHGLLRGPPLPKSIKTTLSQNIQGTYLGHDLQSSYWLPPLFLGAFLPHQRVRQ